MPPRCARWLVAALLLGPAACTDDTTGLDPTGGPGGPGGGPGTPGGPSTPEDCDDGIPCTLDTGTPGNCRHEPRDELCQDTPCATGVCQVGAGCVSRSAPDGMICADCLPCEPCICQQGACARVLAPEGTACNDLDDCTTDDACRNGACTGSPIGGPPTVVARSYLVDAPVSGTFVGDRLAVEIRAGGSRVRWVGGEDVLAPLGPVGPTMDGSAQLFRHRTGYVRVSANARGGLMLEPIVDNGNYDLEAPTGTIVATRPSDAPTMVTLADDHLYFCARDAGGRAALHRLALVPLGTATPVLPANDVNDPCRPPAGGGATANGAYWARWTNGGTGPMLTVLRMYPDRYDVPISFGYVPDGQHQYGLIETVATSEFGFVVMAVENPQWVYVLDASGFGAIETAAVNRAPNTHLLGVHGRTAIFHEGTDLRLSDLTDTGRPGSRRVAADLAPSSEGPARLLDVEATRLALVDADGRLHWLDGTAAAPYGLPREVRGQGLLQDVIDFGVDLIGWSERSLVHMTPSWVVMPSPSEAPPRVDRPPGELVSVGRTAGRFQVLLGRAASDTRHACSDQSPGRCPRDAPTGAHTNIHYIEVSPLGAGLRSYTQARFGPWPVMSARGQAFFFDDNPTGARYGIATIESGQFSATVRGLAAPNAPTDDIRVDEHPGALTVRSDRQAVLFEMREGLDPTFLAQVEHPGLIGAAWVAPYWYLFTEGEGGAEVRRVIRYRVDGAAAPLTRYEDIVLTGYAQRVLGQDEARIFTEQADRIEVWRTGREASLVSIGTLQADAGSVRVTTTDLGPVIVHPDGLSLLSASCN